MSFSDLGLSDSLLRAVEKNGYTTPTPIQAKAIPAILGNNDVMAAAQTGTGKTAGFVLPILQVMQDFPKVAKGKVHALILTPTRELAAQVKENIDTYGRFDDVTAAVVFGGVNITPQLKKLGGGVDILVATPGRLLDLYQQKAFSFSDLEILVLDEADRMLDMGFIRDIRKIINLLPKQRQNLLFSATFSKEIRGLASTFCNDPVEIDVAPRNSTVDAITQKLYMVGKERKADLLSYLIQQTTEQVLVFSRTKHGANNLVKRLARDSINALAIHGNKSQAQRTKALRDFKQDTVQVLVATDIAARGIDIDLLSLVVNYDMPHVAEDYIHRIGRTGRAGASGVAISFVANDEKKQLKAIENLIKCKIEVLSFESLPLRASSNVDSDTRDNRPRSANRNSKPANSNKPANGKARRYGKASGSGRGNGNGNGNGNGKPQSGNKTQGNWSGRNSGGSSSKPNIRAA